MNVRDIFDFLNEKFPVATACDFDNTGILIGNPDTEIKNVMIVLDCTLEATLSAVENNCQLIITHHPVIFNPLKNVIEGSVVYEVLKNNLSVISMHTNLDIGNGGVNDCLCHILNLNNVEKIIAHDGFELRKGSIPPISADNLAKHIKNRLGGCVKYVGCENLIKNVLVCSGSGGEFLQDVTINNCDALITADVKHNYFIDAENSGIALFDAGHFNTEDVVIEPLKELLKKQYENINFFTNHSSKIKFI